MVISRLQSVSGEIETDIEVMRAEGDICYVTLFLELAAEDVPSQRGGWRPSTPDHLPLNVTVGNNILVTLVSERSHQQDTLGIPPRSKRRSLLNLARECFTFHICGDRYGAAPY